MAVEDEIAAFALRLGKLLLGAVGGDKKAAFATIKAAREKRRRERDARIKRKHGR